MGFQFITFECIISVLVLLFLVHSSAFAKIVPQNYPSTNNHHRKLSQIKSNNNNNNNGSSLYETRYFTQTLDHFNYNPQSYETFQQRYLINDKYWGGGKENAPIFVLMGGESYITVSAQNAGLLFDIAPQFKALLLFIEHRYYGESLPFGDKETTYKNASTRGYLSVNQALADYATLILDLKKNFSAIDSPVFVFGGSYAGGLATYFRLKYPHIAMGALASSAVIYGSVNTTAQSFNDIVTQDFRSVSENCYKVIKGSWNQLYETANKTGGIEELRSKFNICKDEEFTAATIENWLSSAIVYTAMLDYPTPSDVLKPKPAYPVKEMCKAIDNPTTNDVFVKLHGLASIYYNYTGTESCFRLGDADGDIEAIGAGPFTWQVCTELSGEGNVNVKDSKESIFPEPEPSSGNSSNSFNSDCLNITGGVPRRPHWIPTEFGALGMQRVLRRFGSNIIFYNGNRDPYSYYGVKNNISDSVVAVVAKEGAHHGDMRFASKDDPNWLKELREKEIGYIRGWLSQYYTDLKEIPN